MKCEIRRSSGGDGGVVTGTKLLLPRWEGKTYLRGCQGSSSSRPIAGWRQQPPLARRFQSRSTVDAGLINTRFPPSCQLIAPHVAEQGFNALLNEMAIGTAARTRLAPETTPGTLIRLQELWAGARPMLRLPLCCHKTSGAPSFIVFSRCCQ